MTGPFDYIMKAPFVTNAQHFHSRKLCSVDAIMKHIRVVVNDISGVHRRPSCYVIPYMMLQKRLDNNSEVKLVFLDKKFSHIASMANTVKSFEDYPQDKLAAFGYEVLSILSQYEEVFILDGLLRIDLFKTEDGKLVVNELESLEAEHYGSFEEESRVGEFLKRYWEKKIYDCITSHLHCDFS
jgi:hypothetical protein